MPGQTKGAGTMKTSPRILQVANYAGPLFCFMQPLCQTLQRAGAEVELACMPGGASWEPLKHSGFKLHELPPARWSNPLNWWKIYRGLRLLLQTGGFDLMIVHTPAMSWIARPAARGLVPANIYFSHGLPFAPEQARIHHLVFRCIEKFMSRYTDAIIVMNSDDVAACRKYGLTRANGQCFYVPGVGVDVDKYAARPAEYLTTKLEQELGLTAGKPMILFLGRFIGSKRPADVLKLAQRIGHKVDFVLAGEGPLWKRIRDAAARIGPYVKVIKFTDQVPLLLARCSLVVLPSVFREGLPRVLLEAYAASKPAVAYDVRGVRDIIEDGKTGFLIRPGDVDGLCEAATELLRNEQLRVRMGLDGQKRIREKFSLDISLSAIMSIVCSML